MAMAGFGKGGGIGVADAPGPAPREGPAEADPVDRRQVKRLRVLTVFAAQAQDAVMVLNELQENLERAPRGLVPWGRSVSAERRGVSCLRPRCIWRRLETRQRLRSSAQSRGQWPEWGGEAHGSGGEQVAAAPGAGSQASAGGAVGQVREDSSEETLR